MTTNFVNPLVRHTPAVIQATQNIKQWTREALSLPDEAVVSVNELACHVPGCPPKETVVLVMHMARTIQVSIHKAMQDVTGDDIAQAFSATTPARTDLF